MSPPAFCPSWQAHLLQLHLLRKLRPRASGRRARCAPHRRAMLVPMSPPFRGAALSTSAHLLLSSLYTSEYIVSACDERRLRRRAPLCGRSFRSAVEKLPGSRPRCRELSLVRVVAEGGHADEHVRARRAADAAEGDAVEVLALQAELQVAEP